MDHFLSANNLPKWILRNTPSLMVNRGVLNLRDKCAVVLLHQ